MCSFSYLEPVCCSMSSFKCCFLTCIQISQDTCQVVWYLHLFQNCPQFIVIHTVKGFGIGSKAEIDVFLELYCFFNDFLMKDLSIFQIMTILSLVPLPFLKPAWTSGSWGFMYCWSLACRILSITLLDLIDRGPDELWTEVHDVVQDTGIKTIPMEKKCKKQNGCLGRPYK